MLTPRNLVIVAAAAGALTGLPWSNAQACDNDRFPCPIVQEAPTQDSADAPARASAQSKKKSTQAAQQQGEKPSAKAERDASQASARPKPSKPSAHEQTDSHAKAGKPAGQQPDASGAPPAPAAEAAPAVVPSPEPSRSAEPARIESAPVPAAAVAPASADAASIAPKAPAGGATQTAAAGNVRVVDPNEVNELDLAAAAPATAPAESSWLSYLLVTLGGALAAASTVRLFLF